MEKLYNRQKKSNERVVFITAGTVCLSLTFEFSAVAFFFFFLPFDASSLCPETLPPSLVCKWSVKLSAGICISHSQAYKSIYKSSQDSLLVFKLILLLQCMTFALIHDVASSCEPSPTHVPF